MIEKGKKCTIYPDNQEVYEIVDVKIKTIQFKFDEKTMTETNYFVDLKGVENSSKINNISIYNINLIND